MLQEALNSWPQFASKYDFDPQTGFLVNPRHQVTSFNLEKIIPILEHLSQNQSLNDMQQLFLNFPDVQLKQQRNNMDMIFLHDSLCFVVQYFLLYCKLINRPISQSILPKNIAFPIYISSNQLKLKYGLCMGMQANWYPLNSNFLTQNFGFQDFQFRVKLTRNYKGQKLVLGNGVVTSFYLAKIIKLIFQANKIIEVEPTKTNLVIEKLLKAKVYLKIIVKSNMKIINQLEKDFFWEELRPMLGGFNDLIFEGVQDNQNKVISSTGGAGGHDPSYQIFERGIGIIYQGIQMQTQKHLQNSMTGNHVALINYFQENSLVRQYCQCTKPLTEAYNEVIVSYSQFLQIHASFIKIFVLKQMMETTQGAYGEKASQQNKKGQGGVQINSIMKRYQTVKKFCL